MSQKTTNIPIAEGVDSERYLAFLSYQLGGLPVLFRAAAEVLWLTADEGDPLPPSLRAWTNQLLDLLDRLVGHAADQSAYRYRDDTRRPATELMRLYEGEWGGHGHREMMAARDGSDAELLVVGELVHGSVMTSTDWEAMELAVRGFADSLHPGVARWARLGALIVSVLVLPADSDAAIGLLPLLQNQLAELRDHPLLAGAQQDLSVNDFLSEEPPRYASHQVWVRERVRGIHEHLEVAFTKQASNESGEGVHEGAEPRTPSLRKGTLAVALLIEHPEWSDVRIAAEVGCDRTTLFRDKKYRMARALLREEKAQLPRGRKSMGREGTSSLDAEMPAREE